MQIFARHTCLKFSDTAAPKVVLCDVIQNDPENTDLGMDYMVLAAEAGDRGAMIYVGKAFQTGVGLGTRRLVNYVKELRRETNTF